MKILMDNLKKIVYFFAMTIVLGIICFLLGFGIGVALEKKIQAFVDKKVHKETNKKR
jgi:hypothetical protein